MGTSGNRKGYKVFSITTTIRNPQRNIDFLETFKRFDGKVMDDESLFVYLTELVKRGIYKFQNVPKSIKDKLDGDEELSHEEVALLVELNPQATGWSGRVKTQLRGLKDQGFLKFDGKVKTITQLGHELLANKQEVSFVYTRAMLGMHYLNPCRTTALNRAVPFLNTLFVINEVNKLWSELGNEPKGVLKHEFGVFVLSMKDCDYKKAAKDIIEYRQKYRYEPNIAYFEKYLYDNDILPIKATSLIADYPDDVFRKFEMTGLIVQHGAFRYIYYNFSQYNLEKIKALLDMYADYSFKEFQNQDEYYDYLASIKLPWENSERIRRKVIETKAAVLKMTPSPSLSLDDQEALLDRMFYTEALARAVQRADLNMVYKELLILSGKEKSESKYTAIPEPLRLEYLLALALGKKFGVNGLVSNIIYNEEGYPLHCAPSGKCDIIYLHNDGAYIIEPTMQRGRTQQLNSETTNITRHVEAEKRETGLDYRVMMVAPYVHPDVIDYFQYQIRSTKTKMLTLTIDRVVNLFKLSDSVSKLNDNFDDILGWFMSLEIDKVADRINLSDD